MLLFCMFLFRFTKLFSNLMFSIADEIIGHTNDCAHTHTHTLQATVEKLHVKEMEKCRKTVALFFCYLSGCRFGVTDVLYAHYKCTSARRKCWKFNYVKFIFRLNIILTINIYRMQWFCCYWTQLFHFMPNNFNNKTVVSADKWVDKNIRT